MNAEEISKLSDEELVQLQGGIGDPDFREIVLAEERRRSVEKALVQSKRANFIAIVSLIVATVSLIVAVIAMFE